MGTKTQQVLNLNWVMQGSTSRERTMNSEENQRMSKKIPNIKFGSLRFRLPSHDFLLCINRVKTIKSITGVTVQSIVHCCCDYNTILQSAGMMWQLIFRFFYSKNMRASLQEKSIDSARECRHISEQMERRLPVQLRHHWWVKTCW